MERFAKYKHSILLRTFVSYGSKSFITLGPAIKKSLLKFWKKYLRSALNVCKIQVRYRSL